MGKIWMYIVTGLGLVFIGTAPAWAQRATVHGSVVDETNARLPGVAVTLLNLDQGTRRETVTDQDGAFVLALLSPGRYVLSAQLTGFAPYEHRGLVLHVGDEVELLVRLMVGRIGETVTVTDDSGRVPTTPAIGTVVDRAFVERIPTNGRSFQSLLTLTPGVVIAKSSFSDPGQFSVNGQRLNANTFLIDGVSGNVATGSALTPGQEAAGAIPGFNVSGGTSNLVSMEALEEFRVQTSTFAPEYGRTPGGQISIVTRAGTNHVHGSVFDYVRNDALDATDWFIKRNGLPKTPLRQHDFGGAGGGPLVRERLFGFGSYEGLRLDLPQARTVSVPSTESRAQASAAIAPFLQAYPQPTGPAAANGLAPFAAGWSDETRIDATSIRVDARVAGGTIFARVAHAPSQSVVRTRVLNTRLHTSADTTTTTIGATHAMRWAVNDLRVNVSRGAAETFEHMDGFGGGAVPELASLLPPGTPLDRSRFLMSIGTVSWGMGVNAANEQHQINFVDTIGLSAGRHALKFGIDYRRLSPHAGPRAYSLNPVFTNVAQVLSGVAPSVFLDGEEALTVRFQNLSLFAQDAWTVGPRLTVTYGARWEVNPAPRGVDQPLYTLTGLDDPSTAAFAAPDTPLYRTRWNRIAPRVGAAFTLTRSPGRETVVRGGAGTFYDQGWGTLAASMTSFPYLRSITATNVPFPVPAARAALPPFTTTPPADTIMIPDANLDLPRTYQWSVTLDRALGASTGVTASYVGAAGRELLRIASYRTFRADLTRLRITRNDAESDYRALQVQLRRRLAHGLQATAAYTWARSLDTASSDALLLSPGERLDPRSDRGPSDFDVRHAFTAVATFEVPRQATGWRRALGGWSLSALAVARSAFPITVTSSRNLGFGAFPFRPDVVNGQPFTIDDPTAPGGWRLNRAAFVVPTEVRQGTLARNSLRGFPAVQIDGSIGRRVRVGTAAIDLRVELFNLLNRPNFADPVSDLDTSTFGQSTTMLSRGLGGLNALYQIGGPRSVQIVGRVGF